MRGLPGLRGQLELRKGSLITLWSVSFAVGGTVSAPHQYRRVEFSYAFLVLPAGRRSQRRPNVSNHHPNETKWRVVLSQTFRRFARTLVHQSDQDGSTVHPKAVDALL
jgi:hypothetical protein